jgi:hypothetical protein
MNGDIKSTFIQNALERYFDEVKPAVRVLIRRQKVGVTEHLVNSLASRVFKETAGARGELLFDESGRFIDMGVGKGHKLGGLKASKAAFSRSSSPQGPGDRKPKKIYSRVAYGKLTALQNHLLHGYTEEAIAQIKNGMINGTSLN